MFEGEREKNCPDILFNRSLSHTSNVCSIEKKEIDEQAPDEWKTMQIALSPTSYRSQLNHTQKTQLDNWQSKRSALVQEYTQKGVAKILQNDTNLSRKSTAFVKFLVRACSSRPNSTNHKAVLTIWNPTEEQINLFQEGCVIRCKNLGVKSSTAHPLQLSANSNTSLDKLTPQPPPSFIESQGYEPRKYEYLMYSEIESKRLSFNPTNSAENDCCGCLIKAIESSTRLLIYLTDESKCVIRIERDFDDCINTSLHHWKKGILDLPIGSCLFFRDIQILPFDPWEDCAVGYWVETSSQHNESERAMHLRQWYSSGGFADCNLADLRLSCGIVRRPPSNTAIIVGSIRSFELLEMVSNQESERKALRLQDFIWGLTIDSGSGIYRAAITPNCHTQFANVFQISMIDIIQKQVSQQELEVLVEYFEGYFSSSTDTFRFVVDTESECIIQVIKVCMTDLCKYITCSQ